ncbi:MAG TPA: PAS domain-containing protein [Polyangiaceae bacterium]|nr:PAS domain-containing protein [Polyangiaceae bacterium]
MTTWHELLMRDHEVTERLFEAFGNALAREDGPGIKAVRMARLYFSEYVDRCHNQKEEQHLFPLIEKRGIPRRGGPLAVMISEHGKSQTMLSTLVPLMEAYEQGDKSTLEPLRQAFAEYSTLLKNHFWKENDILYPMARKVLSEEDGASIVQGIEALEASFGPDTRAKYYDMANQIEVHGGIEALSKSLDPDVLAAILDTLPVELSFVDENDVVRYFSHEHLPKMFPRTRGVIGNTVQNCHPQKSVHLVNQILADFKAGKRDDAEFWIDMGGKKIHIRYMPVRNHQCTYLGCLETVQDITHIQSLTGQKRLLDEE